MLYFKYLRSLPFAFLYDLEWGMCRNAYAMSMVSKRRGYEMIMGTDFYALRFLFDKFCQIL